MKGKKKKERERQKVRWMILFMYNIICVYAYVQYEPLIHFEW